MRRLVVILALIMLFPCAVGADTGSVGGLTANCCPPADCGASKWNALIQDTNRNAQVYMQPRHIDEAIECVADLGEAWKKIMNFKLSMPTTSAIKSAIVNAMENAAQKVVQEVVEAVCSKVEQFTDAAENLPTTLEGKITSAASSVSSELRNLLNSDINQARNAVPTYTTPDISGSIASSATGALRSAHSSIK